ncbi:hypothetical protein BY996DRAFT_6411787 [Phakopsora pachyrhizi]|nr:hypothetical protein BY996DRAFT_6411787 [Phakopsora pachyrhizi]
MHNAKKYYGEDEQVSTPGVASPVVATPVGGHFTAAPANAYEERLKDPVAGKLNQISRVELMHKLARTGQPTSVPVTEMFKPKIPTTTSLLVLLNNMFYPEEETEPG